MKMNDKNDKDSPSVVSFSLRIDTELKRQFEQFCDDVGISIKRLSGNNAFLLKFQQNHHKKKESENAARL